MNILIKKWASQPKYFWKSWLQKTWLLRRSCFWKPFSGQPESRKLVNLSPKNCWNLQKSSLILGLLVNALTADYEYFCRNTETLPRTIQTQLSTKPKIFCWNFIAFLESAFNFEHIDKKMSLIAQVFLKLLLPKVVIT